MPIFSGIGLSYINDLMLILVFNQIGKSVKDLTPFFISIDKLLRSGAVYTKIPENFMEKATFGLNTGVFHGK